MEKNSMAEDNYKLAIQCLKEVQLDEQMQVVLASVYTNLASCVTMMHRYQEAEEMLKESKKILPKQPGREASEAILYATMHEEGKVKAFLDKLNVQKNWKFEITN